MKNDFFNPDALSEIFEGIAPNFEEITRIQNGIVASNAKLLPRIVKLAPESQRPALIREVLQTALENDAPREIVRALASCIDCSNLAPKSAQPPKGVQRPKGYAAIAKKLSAHLGVPVTFGPG